MRTTTVPVKPLQPGASTLMALLSLSLLLLRLLLRLRLAAFRDAALSLNLLARVRLRPVLLRLPGPDGTVLRGWCPASPSSKLNLIFLGAATQHIFVNLSAVEKELHILSPYLVSGGTLDNPQLDLDLRGNDKVGLGTDMVMEEIANNTEFLKNNYSVHHFPENGVFEDVFGVGRLGNNRCSCSEFCYS